MQLRAPWRRVDDRRLPRFQDVLLAAQATPGYREPLRVAGLDSPRSIRRVRSIEAALRRLPIVPHERLHSRPGDFQNPDVAEFEHRCFSAPPDVIAAPLEVLLDRASGYHRNGGHQAHHGVIALTSFASGPMPEHTRDLLWRAFEVPVFEQWIDLDGAVLAAECEAHDGMHVLEDSAVIELGAQGQVIVTSLAGRRYPLLRIAAGFAGTLIHEPCACGESGPRLCVVDEAIAEQPIGAFAAISR